MGIKTEIQKYAKNRVENHLRLKSLEKLRITRFTRLLLTFIKVSGVIANLN